MSLCLVLKLRLLLADQFTVSKCLCCSFPIGYNFGICHLWQIHWGHFTWPPKAVLCCRSVQMPFWGCLCRTVGALCPHALTITLSQADPRPQTPLRWCARVRGPAAVHPCGPWLPPQHDGDCHRCVVQRHRGPPCPWGHVQLVGKTFPMGKSLCVPPPQCPLIAH